MNWDRIEGNWKQVVGKVRERWGKITDQDITILQGKKEQLIGKIQERYGVTKEKAESDIDDWCKSLEKASSSSRSPGTESGHYR